MTFEEALDMKVERLSMGFLVFCFLCPALGVATDKDAIMNKRDTYEIFGVEPETDAGMKVRHV